MRTAQRSLLASSLFVGAAILAFAPALAFAHGGDESSEAGHSGHGSMGGDMGGMSGMGGASNETIEEIVYAPTYFAHPENRGLMYAHIALMTLGWVFSLPAAVMLSLARSRYTLAAQLVFLSMNGTGLVFAAIYNASTPDLYPNNAHHKVGWIATWVISSQIVVGLLARVAGALGGKKADSDEGHALGGSGERQAFIPVSTEALAAHRQTHGGYHRHIASTGSASFRTSNDSGQGTEPNTESLRSNSISTLDNLDAEQRYKEEGDDADGLRHSPYGDDDDLDFEEADLDNVRLPAATAPGIASRFPVVRRAYALTASVASKISTRAWRVLMFGYNVVDRVILILGFIAFCLGIIAYGRFFEGHHIFSGLAHWIKGGVFFWLGILTLGRWAGCFGEWGWAWNVTPKSASNKWRPSAEFVESFLIFFYGATNIFLEHLGNAGKAYSAQDLEHISITVLFLGGGLCGMLVESTRIRDLLNTTVTEAVHEYPDSHYHDEERDALRQPETYQFSINPIPALVILLLGIMMSSHTQHTMISSMVHKQWGNLLTGASFARGFSYVLMYLRPPRSILPSRPPTELLASFGLIAGGVIFMASASDTVDGMIHYNLDAMFIYTVTTGLVGLLMAWVILMVALKGWAVRMESGRPNGSYQLA